MKQITTKTLTGKISDHQRHINFAMNKAAKMVNRNHANVNTNVEENHATADKAKWITEGGGCTNSK